MATSAPIERQEKCSPTRYCDMLGFVLHNSPMNMPWALNPVLMTIDDVQHRAVIIRPGKDTPYRDKKFVALYCPFCGTHIEPAVKTEEPKKSWRPWS